MIKLYNFEQTCWACPSAWVADTEDGKEFYARFRWGCLSVYIDESLIYEAELSDSLNGIMDTHEMLDIIKATIETYSPNYVEYNDNVWE